MATQTGITIEGPMKPWVVVSDLARPKPGPNQVLVKGLFTGINPVEPLMRQTGVLVVSWPAVLGCDGSGVVVEAGPGVSRLQVGDHVYGCTAVGQNKYSTFQEYFLMDEDLAFKRGANVSAEAACTIGVGLDTAALALLSGTNMTLPEPGTKAEEKDEWVVVIGGSGNVGQYGIQLARLCGYKVLATCSPDKEKIVLDAGAHASLNHRLGEDEQVAAIRKATDGGKFARVFDASAYGYRLAVRALEEVCAVTPKWFTTVDDWSEYNTPASITEYRIHLGQLGRREDKLGIETTKDIAGYIPVLEKFIESGDITPLDYTLVEGSGWDKVVEACWTLENGKADKKLVVKIQDE